MKVRAGGGHVVHIGQGPDVAAGDVAGRCGDCRHHFAFFDALGRVVLVINADVQQLIAALGEGGHGIHKPAIE